MNGQEKITEELPITENEFGDKEFQEEIESNIKKAEQKVRVSTTPNPDIPPWDIDYISAIIETGIQPSQLNSQLRPQDNVYINSSEYYEKKYLDKFGGDKKAFNQFYEVMAQNYEMADQVRRIYGTPNPTFEEKMGQLIGMPKPPSYGLPVGPALQKVEPQDVGLIDTTTGIPEYYLSEKERASNRNFYTEKIGDKEYVSPWNPRDQSDARVGTKLASLIFIPGLNNDKYHFYINHEQDGSPYWSKEPTDEYRHRDNVMSMWGDQEKYDSKWYSNVLKFYSGFLDTMGKGMMTTTKMTSVDSFYLTNKLLFGKDADEFFEQYGIGFNKDYVSRWLNKSINELNAMSYEDSEQVERQMFYESWYAAINMLAYQSGMMVAQRLIGGMGAGAGQGMARFMGTLGGSFPAIDMVIESALENGLSEEHAIGMGIAAAPLVGITEYTSAGFLTRGLGRVAADEFQVATKKVLTEAVKDGLDLTKDVPKLSIASKIFKSLWGNESFVTKLAQQGKSPITRFFTKIPYSIFNAGPTESFQEVTEEFSYGLDEALYDKFIAGSETIPGQGKYGTNLTSGVFWKRLRDNGTAGFFVGGLMDMTIPHPQTRTQQDIIDNAIRYEGRKGIDKLIDSQYRFWKKDGFGSTRNADGSRTVNDKPFEPIKVDKGIKGLEDGLLRSQADALYYQNVKTIEDRWALWQSAGISDPIKRVVFASEPVLIKEYLDNYIKLSKAQKNLTSLTDKLNTITDVDEKTKTQNEIDSLTKEINGYDQEVEVKGQKIKQHIPGLLDINNDLILPEENTKFSKRTNDRIKSIIILDELSQRDTDKYFKEEKGITPDNQFKKSDSYQKIYIQNWTKRVRDLPYGNARRYFSGYEQYIKVKNERINDPNNNRLKEVTELETLVNSIPFDMKLNETHKTDIDELEKLNKELFDELDGINNERINDGLKPIELGEMINQVDPKRVIEVSDKISRRVGLLVKLDTANTNLQSNIITQLQKIADTKPTYTHRDLANRLSTLNDLFKTESELFHKRVYDRTDNLEKQYSGADNIFNQTEDTINARLNRNKDFTYGDDIEYNSIVDPGIREHGVIINKKPLYNKLGEQDGILYSVRLHNTDNVQEIDSRQYRINSHDGVIEDNEKIFSEKLISEFRTQIDDFNRLISGDGNGAFDYGINNIQQSVAELLNAINKVTDTIESSNILANTEKTKPHIIPQDIIIENTLYNELKNELGKIKTELETIKDNLEKLAANRGVANDLNRIATITQKIFSLQLLARDGRQTGYTPGSPLDEAAKEREKLLGLYNSIEKYGIKQKIDALPDLQLLGKIGEALTDKQKEQLLVYEKLLKEIENDLFIYREHIFGNEKDGFKNTKNFLEAFFMVFYKGGDTSYYNANLVFQRNGNIRLEDGKLGFDTVEEANPRFYCFFVNYITRIQGINLNEVQKVRTKIYGKRLKKNVDGSKDVSDFVSDTKFNPSTIEQEIAEDQILAFRHSKNALFNAIVDFELSLREKSEVKNWYNDITNLRIKNGIVLTGDFGSGKTFQIPSMVYRIEEELGELKQKENIVICSLTPAGVGIFADTFGGIGGINITQSTIENLLSPDSNISLKGIKTVFVDEARGFTSEMVIKIKKITDSNPNIQFIFMGDKAQMIPLDSPQNAWRSIDLIGLRTNGLSVSFSTDEPTITQIIKWVSSYQEFGDIFRRDVPMIYMQESTTQESRRGGHWYKNKTEIEDDYIKRILKGDGFTKAIVFLDKKGYNKFKERVEILHGKDTSNTNLILKNAYTIDYKSSSIIPSSIQGFRFEEVYISLDFTDLSGETDTIIKVKELKENILHTGVTRASKFIGLVNETYNRLYNLTERPTYWKKVSGVTLTPQQRYDNTLEEYNRLQSTVYTPVKQQITPSVPPPVPPTPPKNIYTGRQMFINKGKLHRGKYIQITNEDKTTVTGNLLSEYNGQPIQKNVKISIDNITNVPLDLSGRSMIVEVAGKFYTFNNKYPSGTLISLISGTTLNWTIGTIIENKNGEQFEFQGIYEGYEGNKSNIIGLINPIDGRIQYVHLDDIKFYHPVKNNLHEELHNQVIDNQKVVIMSGSNSLPVYGTSYSVLTKALIDDGIDPINFGPIVEKVRAVSTLLMNISDVFDLGLSYIRKGTYYGGKESNDLLCVTLNPKQGQIDNLITRLNDFANKYTDLKEEINSIIQSLLSNRTIPNRYKYFMLLQKTEINHGIGYEGKYESLDEVNDLIDKGFITHPDSLKLRNINKQLAKLRYEGRQSNNDIYNFPFTLTFNTSIGRNNGQNSTVHYDPLKKNSIKNIQDGIRSELSHKTVQFGEVVRRSFDDGIIKYVMPYWFDNLPTKDSPYIVFNAKKIGEIPGYIDELIKGLKNDLSILNGLDKKVSFSTFDNTKKGMVFNKILVANISNKDFGNSWKIDNWLTTFFIKSEKGFNIKRKLGFSGTNINNERTVLKEFLESFISGLENTKTVSQTSNEIFNPLISGWYAHITINTKPNIDNTFSVLQSELDKLETNADNIHLPYGFINLNNTIVPPSNSSSNKQGTIPLDVDPPFFIKEISLGNTISNIVFDNTINETKSIITRIIGESFAENAEFKLGLKYNSIELFGMMKSGKLYYDLNKRGKVDSRAIRHEIFHLVFNHMLDDKIKSELINEVREVLDQPELNTNVAEEWMARRYGKLGTISTETIKTKKGLLQRFIDFLNRIFNRIVHTPTLDKLFDEMESGMYVDAPMRFVEGVDTKLMTKNSEDVQMDDTESDLSDDEYVEEVQETAYEKLNKVFPGQEAIINIRKIVSEKFEAYTAYSNNIEVLPEQIVNPFLSLYNVFANEREKNGEIETLTGKKVSELTLDDLLTLQLPDNIKIAYTNYHLGDIEIMKSFVSLIFPHMNMEDFTIEKLNNIITGKKDYRLDKAMNDIIKWQLSMVPYRRVFQSEGRLLLMESNKRDGYCSPKLLIDYLYRASTDANTELEKDTTQNFGNLLVKALLKYANKIGLDPNGSMNDQNVVRNTLYSFVQKFYGDISIQSNDLEYGMSSYRDVINRLKNDLRYRDKEIDKNRFMALHNLLNAIESQFSSLHRQRTADIKINRDHSFVRVHDHSQVNIIKNNIITDINTKLLGNTSMLNSSKLAIMEPGSKFQLYDIDENGFYYVKGGLRTQLIKYENGKVSFTEEFLTQKQTWINTLQNFLGLHNLSKQTFQIFLDNPKTVNGEGLPEMINGLTNNKFQSTSPELFTQEFLATSLMNMLWAVKANYEVASAINKATEEYEKTEPTKVTKTKFTKTYREAIRNANKNEYAVLISPFKEMIGTTMSDIDRQDEAALNDETIISEEDKRDQPPKPSDFYNLIKLFASVEENYRGERSNDFSSTYNNKKLFTYQLGSFLSRRIENGSQHFRDQMTKVINNPELKIYYTQNSPHFNSDGTINNPLLDPYDEFTILNTSLVTSGKDIKSTDTFETYDWMRLQIVNFLESVERSSHLNTENLSLSFIPIADKQQLHVVTTQFASQANNNTRLVFLETDDEGNITGAKVNMKLVTKYFGKYFDHTYRLHELSMSKWSRFFMDIRETSTWFKSTNLFEEFYKKKSKIDTMNQGQLVRYFNSEMTRLKSIVKPEQYIEFKQRMLWNLKSISDYNIKTDVNGVDIITIGNATSFNYGTNYKNGEMYTFDNYIEYKNIKDTKGIDSKEMTDFIDKIYSPSLRMYANRLQNRGFHLPDRFNNITPGNKNIIDWTVEGSKGINPLLKAHYYAYEILQQSINPLTFGDYNDAEDYTMAVKRAGPITTGGTKPIPNVLYGLGNQVRVIMIDGLKMIDPITGSIIDVADGEMVANILTEQFLMTNFGGYDLSPVTKSPMKSLVNSIDLSNGDNIQIKHAADFMTDTLFRNSPMYQRMLNEMLDHTDNMIKQIIPDYNINLYQQLMIRFKQLGDLKEAAIKLRDDIEENPDFDRYKNAIKNNLVWGMQNSKGVKRPIKGLNLYDYHNNISQQNLMSNVIPVEDIILVLNAYQDTSKIKNVAPPEQQISLLGTGENNTIRASNVFNAMRRIAVLQMDEIRNEINSYEGTEQQKLEKYYRKIGLKGAQARGSASELLSLITDPNITIQMGQLRNTIIQMARNQITEKVIRPRFNGNRVTQLSLFGTYLFEKNGISYQLEDIQKEENENAIKEKRESRFITYQDIYTNSNRTTNTWEWNGYIVRPFKTMREENGVIKRAEIGISYSFVEQFGIRKGESLNDVFTIFFKDGTKQTYSRDTIKEFVSVLNKAHLEGKVDINRTIAIRESLDVITPELEKVLDPVSKIQTLNGYAQQFIETFNNSLDVIIGRVPFNKLGSASIAEIKFFVQDNGNAVYIPPEMMAINDSDFDIDQLSNYFRTFRNKFNTTKIKSTTDVEKLDDIDDILDYIIANIEETYLDPLNKDRILISSNIDNIQSISKGELTKEEEASNLTEEQKDKLTRTSVMSTRYNSFVSAIDAYDTNRIGDVAIGIMARSMNVVAHLSQLNEVQRNLIIKNEDLRMMVSRIDSIGKESIMIRIGDYLQAALDNTKNNTLGGFNISQNAVNIIPVLILYEKSDRYIRTFFHNKFISDIIANADKGNRIDKSKRDFNIFSSIEYTRNEQLTIQNTYLKKYYNGVELNETLEKEIINHAEELRKSYKKPTDLLDEINKLKDKITNIEKNITEKNKNLQSSQVIINNINNLKTALIEKEKIYNTNIDIGQQLREVNTFIDSIQALPIIEDLEKYAVIAESFRRSGDFIDLRNGLEGLDFEYDKRYYNYSSYVGEDVSIYNDKIQKNPNSSVDNLEQHMDYFKKNNSMYLSEVDVAKRDRLLKIEERITTMVSPAELIKQIPHIKEYLNIMIENRRNEQKTFVYDNPIINNDLARVFLMRTRLATSWDYSNIRATFMKALSYPLIDIYYNTYQEKVSIDTPTGIDVKGNLIMSGTVLKELNLKNREERQIFVDHFPVWIENLLKMTSDGISEEEKTNIAVQVFGISTDDVTNFKVLLQHNSFVNRLRTYGNLGKESLGLRDSFSLTDETTLGLQKDFEKIMKYYPTIGRTFIHYQLCQYSLNYRKGSMSEVMGKRIYYYFDEIYKTFNSLLNSAYDADNKIIPGDTPYNRFKNTFILYLQHQKGMAVYLNKELKEGKEVHPDVAWTMVELRPKFKQSRTIRWTSTGLWNVDANSEYFISSQFDTGINRGYDSKSPVTVIPVARIFSGLDMAMGYNNLIDLPKSFTFYKGHSYPYYKYVMDETGNLWYPKPIGQIYTVEFTRKGDIDVRAAELEIHSKREESALNAAQKKKELQDIFITGMNRILETRFKDIKPEIFKINMKILQNNGFVSWDGQPNPDRLYNMWLDKKFLISSDPEMFVSYIDGYISDLLNCE